MSQLKVRLTCVLHLVCVLFGRDGLGEVPKFESVVLRHSDQTRLDGVEGQRSHAIKVAPQRVLRIPRLPEWWLLVGRQLRFTENTVQVHQEMCVAPNNSWGMYESLHRSCSLFHRWWLWGRLGRLNPEHSPTRHLSPPAGRTSRRREEMVVAQLQRRK